MKMFKICNAYSGIGGNRKLWDEVLQSKFGNNYEITAVEYDENIAKIYQDFFPNDKVIITDAHQYLLDHFKEFDFIWSSPPCQSHSKLNTMLNKNNINRYPDMSLYQQIIFLKHWFYGKFVIENVKGYYKPLVKPQIIDRHYFWSNMQIESFEIKNKKLPHKKADVKYLEKFFGYDLSKYKLDNKRQCLRNCVLPETANYIIECARGNYNHLNQSQIGLEL